MSDICVTTAYFPPISYVRSLLSADEVWMEVHDYYERQSYRNRCYIAAANGVMSLSIPVERHSGERPLTKDIRISDHANWRHVHWQSIVSAYNMSPFFEYYQDDIAPFFHKKWDFLYDFNMEILCKVLELLEITKEIKLSSQYDVILPQNVVDLRREFHPKSQSSVACGIYYQVFEERHGFLPDLSVMDLLFNMGNESILSLTD